MYEGRKAQRLRNWKWLSTEKQMVGRKKILHKVLAFLTGLLWFFLVVCWFCTLIPPLGLTEMPALALLSGGISLSHWLTMMWSLFCFSDPDLLLPLLSGLLYLRFSTSIRIFEDRGAGPLTGGMGHVVTRICSRLCFCALWFLAEGLGGASKSQSYLEHHQFFNICYA